MIYHVVNKSNWQKAIEQGFYAAESLATEGFIHASRIDQLPGVLNRYYKGQSDLIILHIDENKLQSPFTYELAPSVNEEFPHIYGRLNLDAVLNIEEL